MNENTMLAPERMPSRDENGFVQHPDLDNLLIDPPEGAEEDNAELPLDAAKFRNAGYDWAGVAMDAQLAEDHPAWHRYFTLGEPNCSGWEPDPPPGDGWRLVAIWDTEDGPQAMFVRPLTEAAA